jgi:hypothetical protein
MASFKNLFANVRKIVASGIVCALFFAVAGCERLKLCAINNDNIHI